MTTDAFTVVTFPDIQILMEEEEFEDNACLINYEPFLEEYGSSAYFVRQSWLEELTNRDNEKNYNDTINSLK